MITVLIPVCVLLGIILCKRIPKIGGNVQAALILAGLAADGRTTVEDEGFIRRGYERMEADLRKLGAGISVTDSTDDR